MGWLKHELKESNQLIEEFMLLANIAVPKLIYKKWDGKPSTATLIFNKLEKSPVKRVGAHSELTVARVADNQIVPNAGN